MALTLAEISLWITISLLLLIVTTFVVLGQGWGSGIVRRALALANAGFLGRIEVDGARVFPDGTVIATHARILDPDGRVIIAVERATAHAQLWRLIRKELHLTDARASGIQAAFAVDEAGDLNIARAFQPRHPQPPSAPNQAGDGFAVVIDDFMADVNRAALTIAPAREPIAEVLEAQVSGHLEVTPRGDVILSPHLTRGEFHGPLAGSLTVEGRMTLVGPELTAIASASLGDSSLQVSGELNLDNLSGDVDPLSLVIGPRTLSPWLGPQRPRGARATLIARLDQGTAWLDAFSLWPLDGAGEIDATGSLGLATGDGDAHIFGRQVDARALFQSLPASSIGFELNGAFNRVFGRDRSARAHLHMDPWRWDGQLVGPGQLDAQLRGSTIRATNLDLDVPGARIIGEAELSSERVSGRGTKEARSLGRLRAAITSISRV